MKPTTLLLAALGGLIAWRLFGPQLQQLMLPPGATTTTNPSTPTAPTGQGTSDIFTQVVGILDGLFKGISNAQASPKTI